MEGIMILNTYKAFGIAEFIAMLVLIIGIFLVAWLNFKGGWKYFWTILSAFAIIITIASFRFSDTRYEVLIDDSVPFVEFHENYRVINERGEIFTIMENK